MKYPIAAVETAVILQGSIHAIRAFQFAMVNTSPDHRRIALGHLGRRCFKQVLDRRYLNRTCRIQSYYIVP